MVLGKPLLVGVGRIFLLEVGRIDEHQFEQIGRGRSTVDVPTKTVLHQARCVPGVIDVGVGQDQVVQEAGLETGIFPVEFTQFFQTLEHAAIDQHTLAPGFE